MLKFLTSVFAVFLLTLPASSVQADDYSETINIGCGSSETTGPD
ncbi:MAG: hypothetical protein WBM40_24400 [Thiohalocapsa sp.]